MENENKGNIEGNVSNVDRRDSEEIPSLMEEKHGMVSSPKIDNNPDKILDIDKFKKSIKKNPWMFVSIILGIAVIVLFYFVMNVGSVTGNVVSSDDAGESIVEFLNLRTGGGVEYVSGEDIGNLYEIMVSYQGQEIPVFVTKDGEYYVQGAVSMSEAAAAPAGEDPNQQPPAEVPKSDKPKVELFIMTHCPYGTQSEKGFIPAIELLGDKIDAEVRFVHYFMHDPEEAETSVQVCIREEQSDKWMVYLTCFLEDGDSTRCDVAVGIDTTAVDACISSGKADEYYAEDSALSEQYGVQGSPTLVVNGKIVSSGRSPAAYLDTICQAFNDVPELCASSLDSASPSPMWGWDATGASTSAQC